MGFCPPCYWGSGHGKPHHHGQTSGFSSSVEAISLPWNIKSCTSCSMCGAASIKLSSAMGGNLHPPLHMKHCAYSPGAAFETQELLGAVEGSWAFPASQLSGGAICVTQAVVADCILSHKSVSWGAEESKAHWGAGGHCSGSNRFRMCTFKCLSPNQFRLPPCAMLWRCLRHQLFFNHLKPCECLYTEHFNW